MASIGRSWRLRRRAGVDHVVPYRLGVVAVGLSAVILIGSLNVDATPGEFFSVLWTGTFGSSLGLESIALAALPLVVLGLAVALPYRMGLWNIGADGQLLMGAWAAAGIAISFPSTSGTILIPTMILGGVLLGALWILIPAFARAYLGISEIITTLLLNFVAIYWMIYWSTGPWAEQSTASGSQSVAIAPAARLGDVVVAGVSVPVGLLMAVILALALGVWLSRTRFGFEVRIAGDSPNAAKYAGISARRRLVLMMIVGGAIAGLAGALELMNSTHRYGSTLSGSLGYTAFVVAVLAAGSTVGVMIVAAVLAAMAAGMNALLVFGVSYDLLFATYGIILLLGAMGDGLARFQLVRLRGSSEERGTAASVEQLKAAGEGGI